MVFANSAYFCILVSAGWLVWGGNSATFAYGEYKDKKFELDIDKIRGGGIIRWLDLAYKIEAVRSRS